MIDSYNLDYSKLKPLDVSRETFPDLEEFRSLIIQKNKEINLISTNTEKISKERHIIDSAQIVEFIDKNDKICTDIGSGSGLPGIVLAIIMKHKKSDMMFHLYEKSFHKSNFLIEVSKRLNLKKPNFFLASSALLAVETIKSLSPKYSLIRPLILLSSSTTKI